MMRQELLGEIAGHRRTLLRMVAMYSPLTAGAGVLCVVSLTAVLRDSSYGALVPLIILLLVAGAAFFQLLSALRDLRAEPTFSRGEVTRLWTKGGLFWFFRSHYTTINRQVFVMAPEIWVQLVEGNTIECHHWPHTRTLISVVLLSGDLGELVPGEPVSPLPEA